MAKFKVYKAWCFCVEADSQAEAEALVADMDSNEASNDGEVYSDETIRED